MHRLFTRAVAGFVALAVLLVSSGRVCADAPPSMAPGREQGDLVDVAVHVGTLTRFLAALRAADRVALLHEPGPRTLFAPGDEAFAKLPAGALDELLRPENVEKLRALLLRHLVPGRLAVADLKTGDVQTLNGDRLAVQRDVAASTLIIAGARVVKPDLKATNGVLHVIDQVLLPPPSQP